MNAPTLRLKDAINTALAGKDRGKLEGIVASIELSFEVKDRALRMAKSALESNKVNIDAREHHGIALRGVIDAALMPWSHNTDEVKS